MYIQAVGTGHRRLRLFIGASVFLAALAFYLSNATRLAPCFFATNDGPFLGGDTIEIAEAMGQITFSGDMRKHLLFSVVTAPLVNAVGSVLGVGEKKAIIYVLGSLAAAAVTSTWWVLARHVTTALYALLFAVVYGVAFVNLIVYSIPETYAVTGLAIIGYFWLLLSRAPGITLRDACVHGLAAGLAGLFNPPLLSLLAVSVLHAAERGALRRNVMFAGTALVVALVVFALPYALIHGTKILDFGLNYMRSWASFHNLAEIRNTSFVYISFFVVSFLSPLDMSAPGYSLRDFLNYLTQPHLLLTIILYAALTFIAVKAAIASADKLLVSILVWILIMVTFYTYFNPREAALYAGQIVFPLILLMARGMTSVRPPHWLGPIIVSAFAASLVLQNVPALYRTPSSKVCEAALPP
jgi:hypothetical protein